MTVALPTAALPLSNTISRGRHASPPATSRRPVPVGAT
ncbi:Hypothetical protein A7982_05566 [Minicystis rosea]|nr:Hypothetical protein A7982_05566 [Minicystis rosea]